MCEKSNQKLSTMCMQDMDLSFIYRIPMLRSTVQTVNHKYIQVKKSNIFVNWVLHFVEQCFFLCIQLLSQIPYKDYWFYINNYLYIFVYQYATPVLWSQLTEFYHWSVQMTSEGVAAMSRYMDNTLSGIRGCESPQSSANFDTPSVRMMIDFMTKSLAELKLNENSTSLELNGYENEFHQPGVIVDHSSAICHCDKHHQAYVNNNNNVDTVIDTHKEALANNDRHEVISARSSTADDNIIALSYGKKFQDTNNQPLEKQYPAYFEKQTLPAYTNDYNLNSMPIHQAASSQHDEAISDSSSIADDNIIADSYGVDTQNAKNQPPQLEEQDPNQMEEQTLSGQEWHKLYPSSQPMISMMTPDKAFQLAEALKEKRQDKTGRDAYEVDTVLVLLSQWDVIDGKSKHYAIDRANLLYLAICYGWSYALQKVSPATSAPIVTPSVTPVPDPEPLPLQRQLSNDGIQNPPLQAKRLRKTGVSRSYGSVFSNDSGHHHPYHHNNRYFQRPNQYNNFNRQSFPPNMMYQRGSHFNDGYVYNK